MDNPNEEDSFEQAGCHEREVKFMPRRTTFILVSLAFSVTLIGSSLGVAYAQEEGRRVLRRVERDVDTDVHRDVRRRERENEYGQTGTNPNSQPNSAQSRAQNDMSGSNTNASGQTAAQGAASNIDATSDMSQQQQMRLQEALDRRAKEEAAASNIMKKESDTQDSIINNMK